MTIVSPWEATLKKKKKTKTSINSLRHKLHQAERELDGRASPGREHGAGHGQGCECQPEEDFQVPDSLDHPSSEDFRRLSPVVVVEEEEVVEA